VGRLPPGCLAGAAAAAFGVAERDWRSVAKGLVAVGATGGRGTGAATPPVDLDAFALDLEAAWTGVEALSRRVVVESDGTGAVIAAGLADDVDPREVDAAAAGVLSVGEGYGLRFPRAFGLLVKQALYFDRYLSALAPETDLAADAGVRRARDAAGAVDVDAIDV